jgi:exopolyphosphatase/guanosine-5'-triphosphate,3'-diphosphate pyrophosphatase
MAMDHLAAIDIGTNSFHLIVVKLLDNGSFDIIDREKEVIRLGLSKSVDMKHIQPEAIQRAIECLSRFKIIAQSYNAPIRAVATSAVRESLNKDEFIEQVLEETGIDIEVISGFEEARLIYMGILQAVQIYNKRALCIDIGGGSTEFLVGYQGKIIYANSTKLGAVRLSQMFFPDFELSKSSLEKCSNWVYGELYPIIKELKKHDFDIVVGSSGTIMSAGHIIRARESSYESESVILNNFNLTQSDLQKVTENVLKKTTVKERRKIPGLDEKRADIIPAGLIILNSIVKQLSLKEITISGYALREGIILDTMKKLLPAGNHPELSDIRFQSIKQLAETCQYDKEHSFHVAKLSLQIFDQLEDLHKLDGTARELLQAAAILHDIGFHISHAQHHRHSYYIIRNGELLGFNDNEIEVIANVARYHRKSHPKENHKEYAHLAEKYKNIISKLASLLRIADSLDRTHSQLIQSIEVENNQKNLCLKVFYNNEEPEIELWNLERRKALFEEVFDRKLSIIAEKTPLKVPV